MAKSKLSVPKKNLFKRLIKEAKEKTQAPPYARHVKNLKPLLNFIDPQKDMFKKPVIENSSGTKGYVQNRVPEKIDVPVLPKEVVQRIDDGFINQNTINPYQNTGENQHYQITGDAYNRTYNNEFIPNMYDDYSYRYQMAQGNYYNPYDDDNIIEKPEDPNSFMSIIKESIKGVARLVVPRATFLFTDMAIVGAARKIGEYLPGPSVGEITAGVAVSSIEQFQEKK